MSLFFVNEGSTDPGFINFHSFGGLPSKMCLSSFRSFRKEDKLHGTYKRDLEQLWRVFTTLFTKTLDECLSIPQINQMSS